MLRSRIMQRLDPRTAFLVKAEQLFGKALFQDDIHSSVVKSNLVAVYEQCDRRFWGLPNDVDTIYTKVQTREPLPK